MQRQERLLRDLCIAIAKNEIGGDYFNRLLIEAGIFLDDYEWEAANRLLSASDRLLSFSETAVSMQ